MTLLLTTGWSPRARGGASAPAQGHYPNLDERAHDRIGFCAKLLHEAIEEIDETQVEAITATGASRWQVMAYGIVPQILPAFAGIAVFRWDINIRESSALGLVGAGGIGLQLPHTMAFDSYELLPGLIVDHLGK